MGKESFVKEGEISFRTIKQFRPFYESVRNSESRSSDLLNKGLDFWKDLFTVTRCPVKQAGSKRAVRQRTSYRCW